LWAGNLAFIGAQLLFVCGLCVKQQMLDRNAVAAGTVSSFRVLGVRCVLHAAGSNTLWDVQHNGGSIAHILSCKHDPKGGIDQVQQSTFIACFVSYFEQERCHSAVHRG
jgi:hypothetical protein